MQEQLKQQHIPVKVYRTDERLMIAAPMAGLEPENIVVEVTVDGRLVLHGDLRSMLKEVKELLLDEWSVGVYHRELALPAPVNAECANVTIWSRQRASTTGAPIVRCASSTGMLRMLPPFLAASLAARAISITVRAEPSTP